MGKPISAGDEITCDDDQIRLNPLTQAMYWTRYRCQTTGL